MSRESERPMGQTSIVREVASIDFDGPIDDAHEIEGGDEPANANLR